MMLTYTGQLRKCTIDIALAWDAGCPYCTPDGDCTHMNEGCYVDGPHPRKVA